MTMPVNETVTPTWTRPLLGMAAETQRAQAGTGPTAWQGNGRTLKPFLVPLGCKSGRGWQEFLGDAAPLKVTRRGDERAAWRGSGPGTVVKTHKGGGPPGGAAHPARHPRKCLSNITAGASGSDFRFLSYQKLLLGCVCVCIFPTKPGSKHFSLCGPRGLCHNYSPCGYANRATDKT